MQSGEPSPAPEHRSLDHDRACDAHHGHGGAHHDAHHRDLRGDDHEQPTPPARSGGVRRPGCAAARPTRPPPPRRRRRTPAPSPWSPRSRRRSKASTGSPASLIVGLGSRAVLCGGAGWAAWRRARACHERAGAACPRALHPVAWWIWAVGLAIAVNRTTNPLLLILTLAVLAFVVANRRTDAPWARAFKYYLCSAGFVIVLRVVFRSVFESGVTPTDHILFRLPHIPTPKWYAGVQHRRPGVARGDAVGGRRRAAARHDALLHRRRQRAGQPEARAAAPARRAVRARHGGRGRDHPRARS